VLCFLTRTKSFECRSLSYGRKENGGMGLIHWVSKSLLPIRLWSPATESSRSKGMNRAEFTGGHGIHIKQIISSALLPAASLRPLDPIHSPFGPENRGFAFFSDYSADTFFS